MILSHRRGRSQAKGKGACRNGTTHTILTAHKSEKGCRLAAAMPSSPTFTKIFTNHTLIYTPSFSQQIEFVLFQLNMRATKQLIRINYPTLIINFQNRQYDGPYLKGCAWTKL